ncbi:hypothetical protein [Sulfurimonas sp.]|uniref:hypothetical protein n=1 Tax=Sulfurimonas sp. TaxID=2022749 RepID=UPI003D1463E1
MVIKKYFSLFILILAFVGCGGGSSSGTQTTAPKYRAILGPIVGGELKISPLETNTSLYLGQTDYTGYFTFSVDSNITNDTWLKFAVTGGVDIDSDDDGNTSEGNVSLKWDYLYVMQKR